MMRNTKGFTLIEVLISTLIMGFVLGCLLVLFVKCSLATETFKSTAVAVNHIHTTFEEMRRINNKSDIVDRDWPAWGRDNNYVDLDNRDCTTEDFLTDEDCEKITVTYPSGRTAEPLRVVVTITWKDRIDAEKGRQLQAETLLTER